MVQVFEVLENGQGYFVCYFLNKPSEFEIKLFQEKKFHMRVVKEDNKVLLLLQLGNSNMIFELSLDPTLYIDARAIQFKGINNQITLILINSSTEEVKVIRHANLPLKMIQICSDCWSRAILEPNFSATYTAWLQQLSSASIERLWQRAVSAGTLGKQYSLEEIFYNN